MTEVKPFKAIIYDTSRVKGDDVVCPPYDIITPEMKNALYDRSPYNIIRIDFGKDHEGDNESENRYTRARNFLEQWLKDGILTESPDRCYYLYQVSYSIDGKPITMRGIFGAVRLTELCKGVFPHEATHSKPKADRLNLMKYCRANLSPIFSIYRSSKNNHLSIFDKYTGAPPYISAKDPDGFIHSMWIIDEHADVQSIEEELSEVEVYIADGHHRYETALEYQRLRKQENPSHNGDEPYNFVLMYLVNIQSGGLTILPTHRIVNGVDINKEQLLESLSKEFKIEQVDSSEGLCNTIAGYRRAIGMAFGDSVEGYVLSYDEVHAEDIEPPLRNLDVTVLHEIIIKRLIKAERIIYEMNPDLVMEGIRGHKNRIAFFLNPTRVEDVERVAKACLRMPPKATYFYPKILTGFVINRL
jgi:uncharacterized protein (DUF1015 family)